MKELEFALAQRMIGRYSAIKKQTIMIECLSDEPKGPGSDSGCDRKLVAGQRDGRSVTGCSGDMPDDSSSFHCKYQRVICPAAVTLPGVARRSAKNVPVAGSGSAGVQQWDANALQK